MEANVSGQREGSTAHEAKNDFVDAFAGETLTAVAFGVDFIQFQFDRATLNTKNHPEIVRGGVAHDTEEPAYRDELCAMIGHHVTACSVRADYVIEIEFDDGATLRISLGPICQRNQSTRFERGEITWIL